MARRVDIVYIDSMEVITRVAILIQELEYLHFGQEELRQKQQKLNSVTAMCRYENRKRGFIHFDRGIISNMAIIYGALSIKESNFILLREISVYRAERGIGMLIQLTEENPMDRSRRYLTEMSITCISCSVVMTVDSGSFHSS